MKFCELCLEENNLSSISSLFDCNSKELGAIALIKKYFKIKIVKTSLICLECWAHIESFHTFCLRVAEIHKFNKLGKAGITNDNILKNSKRSKADLTFEFIAVKQEDNANRTVKSNEPFLQSDDESNDLKYDSNENANSYLASLEPIKESIDKTKENKNDTIPEPLNDTSKEKEDETMEIIELLPEDIKLNKEIEDDIDKKLAKLINCACPICGEVQPSFRKLIRHGFNVHKTRGYALCCNIKLFDRNLALEHLSRFHTDVVFDKYKCKDCGKQFASCTNLKNHRLKSHKINKSELFPCELCPNISFSRKEVLQKHQREVHDKKQYKCVECKKVFSDKLKLRAHYRSHSTNSDHVCDICGATYKTKYAFESHHTQKHLGIVKPKQKCDICGNMVKCLREHKYRIHTPAGTIIKCNICDRELKTINALNKHKQFAHGEKKFECKVCKKAFRTTKLLREHIATHTGTPLYKCPYCPNTFKYDGNYYKHRKNLHNEEWLKSKKQMIHLT